MTVSQFMVRSSGWPNTRLFPVAIASFMPSTLLEYVRLETILRLPLTIAFGQSLLECELPHF